MAQRDDHSEPAADKSATTQAAREAIRVESPMRLFTPLEAILSGRRWRLAARWIGVIIFILGFVLIGYVFVQALIGFTRLSSPTYLQSQVLRMTNGDTTALVTAYVSVVGGELLRLIYLLLLGYLGSLISTKGIQFFAASESVIDEAVAGVNEA
jgi:hypothetical protein